MACASETHEAQQVPLDLVLLVDTSGSMYELAGAQTKWLLAQNALRMFLRDPRSAGLGIGLQFFPLGGDDRTCTGAGDGLRDARRARRGELRAQERLHHQRPAGAPEPPLRTRPARSARSAGPARPWALRGQRPLLLPDRPGLPGRPGACAAPAPLLPEHRHRQLQPGGLRDPRPSRSRSCPAVEAARSAPRSTGAEPIGATPTAPAVEGTLNHLRQHLAANPGRRACPGALHRRGAFGTAAGARPGAGRDRRGGQQATPSISTYVIGVFGQPGARDRSRQPLGRAGGTGSAIVLTPPRI